MCYLAFETLTKMLLWYLERKLYGLVVSNNLNWINQITNGT